MRAKRSLLRPPMAAGCWRSSSAPQHVHPFRGVSDNVIPLRRQRCADEPVYSRSWSAAALIEFDYGVAVAVQDLMVALLDAGIELPAWLEEAGDEVYERILVPSAAQIGEGSGVRMSLGPSRELLAVLSHMLEQYGLATTG